MVFSVLMKQITFQTITVRADTQAEAEKDAWEFNMESGQWDGKCEEEIVSVDPTEDIGQVTDC